MNQQDLTMGSVFSTMSLFALPMIFGNILQQGYNIVDTWVVGHLIGPDALAAVGSAFAIMTFLTSILLGLCMGSGTVFSLCFGRKDRLGQKNSICASFLLLSVITAILTAASLLGVDAMVAWMNIPVEIAGMTRDYLRLVFCGIPAIAMYNFFGAYLKAIGNSTVPLIFLGISTIQNILLDLLFVAMFQWGTLGAAAATVISQYLSSIGIGLYVFFKQRELRDALLHFNLIKFSLKEIANYSVMTCIQQSVMNLGILMVQGLVNSFGTQLASLLIWLLARPLMLIFIEPSQIGILSEGIQYLHIVGPFYCGIGCLFLFYGLYRAVGKPAVSVVLTVISLGTRVALSYTLSALDVVGVVGIWCSIPIGWGLADLAGSLYYICRLHPSHS